MIKNIIKEERLRCNLTQQQLADSVDVTRQTIIAIESYKYTPSLELAMKFSRFFEKPMEQLFKLEPDEK